MLKRLYVENYALIDRLEFEPGAGLNIITGETGAGKSILLGALGIMLGNRVEATAIKDNQRNCVIEGTFDVSGYSLQELFDSNDLDYDDTVVIRRVLSPNGKSRAYVNELPVQVTLLRELGMRLIDIHSQNQTVMLNDDEYRTGVLDTVASHAQLLDEYRTTFAALKDAERRLETVVREQQQARKEQEYLTFQYEQLSAAQLREGQMKELEDSFSELSNAEQIREVLGVSAQSLNEDEHGVLVALKTIETSLHRIKDVYAGADIIAQRVRETMLELKDIEQQLGAEAERIEADPQALEKATQQLDMLNSLLLKHKVADEKELIALRDNYRERLDRIAFGEDEVRQIGKEIEQKKAQAEQLAKRITADRKKAAVVLKKHVESTLSRLGMPDSVLEVVIDSTDFLDKNGADKIRFMFSSNKGSAPQPIEKVASGGELSRVMLSIKSLVARTLHLPTVIFDEIDTGVSGRIADAMGEIINELAASLQIINITHLPQIASKGEDHYFVYKQDVNGRTQSAVRRLDAGERVEEIAKMLSGNRITESAMDQARSLLSK